MTKYFPEIHIFGAGIAGLATALYCQKNGLKVNVYEAASHAGGRCRSYYDQNLSDVIDNGNHLILGGNKNIFNYLEAIGASEKLQPTQNLFPFIDLDSGEEWCLRPGNAKFPFWLLLARRRIPGTRIADYKALWKISTLSSDATLPMHVDPNSLMFKRFWEPLCNSVLNTEANNGSAMLIGRMLKLTLMRGPTYAQPFITPEGLSATFIDPAIDHLTRNGIKIKFRARLNTISTADGKVTELGVRNSAVRFNEKDHIVLALPPNEIARLLPELTIPFETRPIVNVHFKPNQSTSLPRKVPFVGLINGLSQWIFQREKIFSVTISNAGDIVNQDSSVLAERVWSEITPIIGHSGMPIPSFRVLKERRATIAQTPKQETLRPTSETRWKNLQLAGDWTSTGLPATIESAIQSGLNVTQNILNHCD